MFKIHEALAEAAQEANWSSVKIAVEAGVSQDAARSWLAGRSVPSGTSLLALMHKLPGLSKRLGCKCSSNGKAA
jgi:hypothetical protein